MQTKSGLDDEQLLPVSFLDCSIGWIPQGQIDDFLLAQGCATAAALVLALLLGLATALVA